MILAFKLTDIITVPFGYLLSLLYQLTNNYGLALILFSIVVKIILMPATAKGKKSTMKMSRLTPQIQAIQKKYANDQQKQSMAMQELYKQEGVSMGGGCLWSLLPLLVLLPLYTVVRQPLVYMLHESTETAGKIVEVLKEAAPDAFSGNSYYHQMVAARLLPEYRELLQASVEGLKDATLAGVNFNFLGIDLGSVAQFNIFGWSAYDWAHFGAFLIPLLSAGIQVLSMFVAMRMNNSLVTNEKGIEDKETAQNSQTNQTNKAMMFVGPLMSLWIGFTVPAALSLYWFIQGIVTMLADVYLTKKYRTIYDAEDAERLKKALAEEALEAEKERQRAERRASNPDGITDNTSKKKLQQKQQREQDAARAAAAREYAAKRGVTEAAAEEAPDAPSGIPDRPNCKGRNYDPNRYASHNTEE